MKLFKLIWDFFTTVKLAIVTLCTLAITAVIGTVIPQGEAPGFYIKLYGLKTAHFLQILDITEMYSSWWFLSLLGILSANLVICSLDRLPAVWKIIHADNLTITPTRLKNMAHCRIWEDIPKQLDKINFNNLLKEQGWTAKLKSDAADELYFSQRGRWSRIGAYFVHLSILIIFIGALIGHFFGFKASVMIPEMGESIQKIFPYRSSKTIALGFEVQCNSFVIEFYENGMVKEFKSSLTIFEDGQEVLTKVIEVNDPLTYKGLTFYQSSYQGDQSFIVNISNNDSGVAKQFIIPLGNPTPWQEQSLLFGIINAKAIDQRIVQTKLWLKSAGHPEIAKWFVDNEKETIDSGEHKYTVSIKQRYATGLQIAKDPGVWVVYFGCGLMLLGLYMTFFISHKRIWLYKRVKDDTVWLCLAGSTNKNKVSFDKKFYELEKCIDDIVTVL